MAVSALFRQFVLKVHSRCDLACDHCYVYEHADQSWRGRPLRMTGATMARTAERIADHVRAHGLDEVCLVLHGGEPLLAGPDHLRDLIIALRGPLRGLCDIDLHLHTNGVRLDREFCDLFREHRVKIGISLDGDRAANDRHRLYRDGRSSYDKVVKAVELLRTEYPDLYSGLLCTIDVKNDPIAVYEELLAHEPPAIDFLWPHHTWDRPPPRPSATAYSDWLIRIADRWFADGRPVAIRMFDSITSTSQGGRSFTESLGLEPTDLLVVETDGRYEQVDSLKTAYDGAPGTGTDVFQNSVDQAGEHYGVAARRGGLAALCTQCKECPVVATCGGGLFAHRYRGDGSGFDNPSVYCDDLFTLVEHVRKRVAERPDVLPPAVLRSLAAGHGDRSAISRLKSTQAVGNLSLLVTIGRATTPGPAWDLVKRVEAEDPASLDAVLAHPYVRVWAAERLRDLEWGADPADDGLIAAVACVAAARAGLSAELQIPVRGGAAYFPTVGRFAVLDKDVTTVVVADGRIHVPDAGEPEEVRRVRAGRLSVALEDLDPFRDRHDWPAAGRLSDKEFDRWRIFLREAWELLEADYAEYAEGIAGALSTIVPLKDPGGGRSVSSAARDAFGSVGIALPETPALLCLLLLHEFQHVKLGAVLDFVDLYDANDHAKYQAPWREDLRPIEGLLQGTYAHIAVADFWRRRAQSPDSGTAVEACAHFDEWYPKTLSAVGVLEASGALTGLGEQFVAGMRTTLESWRPPPEVPSAPAPSRGPQRGAAD
ncbi:FxsB family cyclophane-forming radical SAM/SPASM peptide maturase [Actinomadura sp. WMMA1423]|uniref:FxsB family cyclophane-forming radical SAM/SPASM peptide maturase n=1 Tax=Actinomadura sp. WMMA1423 TaxID=2591108 RepID=UPI0011461303|nr:FxsB family cyclophane-forming radical SAM/SPASM peptide maturase [Actinomadura sp. WMMA1423]